MFVSKLAMAKVIAMRTPRTLRSLACFRVRSDWNFAARCAHFSSTSTTTLELPLSSSSCPASPLAFPAPAPRVVVGVISASRDTTEVPAASKGLSKNVPVDSRGIGLGGGGVPSRSEVGVAVGWAMLMWAAVV